MPSETRPTFFTLRTTSGQPATRFVPPDDDPWQAATQHARASFAADSQLAELRIASEAKIAALNARLEDAPLAVARAPDRVPVLRCLLKPCPPWISPRAAPRSTPARSRASRTITLPGPVNCSKTPGARPAW
jgi:hypothetical protein